jgi:hypothetical protein
MNIFNKVLLKIVLAPKNLYYSWGISVPQLESILTCKLIMDDRRPNSIQQTRQRSNNSKKEISNSSVGTILMSGIMGIFFLMVFRLGNDHITHLTFYFSMFITFLCMILISDFTSVLIDVRDNYIILPKPVNDKTVVLARLLHIFIHICKTVLPMALPALIYLSIKYNGIAGFIFFVLTLFATLFSIFLINAIYIIILKITTPEKFKNIISYIQIFFAIFIYASYQLVPRLIGKMELQNFEVAHSSWLILVPSYWLACAFNWLFTFQSTSLEMFAAIIGFVLPIASIYIVIKYLAPSFNQKLAMISGSEGATVTRHKVNYEGNKHIGERIALLVTTNVIEKTGFLFSWNMMARSRDFKVKVYPSIGYIIVLLVVMLLSGNSKGISLQDLRNDSSKSIYTIIIGIYFSSILVLTAITQMTYSDKFKASWMFYITPIEQPGEIISGSIKALLFQFYLFIALILLVIALVLVGPSIIPNIILGISNQLVIIYLIVTIGYKALPFSKSLSNSQKSGMFIRTIFMLFICFLIGALHFSIFRNTLFIIVAFIISVSLLFFLANNLRKISWKQIKMAGENL